MTEESKGTTLALGWTLGKGTYNSTSLGASSAITKQKIFMTSTLSFLLLVAQIMLIYIHIKYI